MARPEYYVDPLNGSDTAGDGLSDATAWQTVQKALNSITKNTTYGDRINVKDTADDVLTAELDFSAIGGYNITYGLLIEGYTATAGDGGVGGISGGGTTGIVVSTRFYLSLRNMHLHNTGANAIVQVYRGAFDSCEFDNTSFTGNAVTVSEGTCSNCYFHNIGGLGLNTPSSLAYGNYFKQGADYSFDSAIQTGSTSRVFSNIISVDGASNGIATAGNPCTVVGNSILSSGGTGIGISFIGNNYASSGLNNLVEGFSIGIQKLDRDLHIVSNNTAFNCTTAFDLNDAFVIENNNTVSSASPFKKSGADTFANRFTYFEPDTSNAGTNMNGNGSQGAVAAAGGGGSTTLPKHPLARF
jgi:hypothetical protein